MGNVPTLNEWLAVPEDERARLVASWNSYGGESEALLKEVVERFRTEFGHLRHAVITGPGVYHGGSWVIGVTHPLVFDRRLLPQYYLGVPVVSSISMPLPPEFEGQEFPDAYVWSPPNFERFVDRCADDVRRELGDQNMTRAEMLHALIGVPYEEHLAHCRAWVAQGRIPRFE